MTDDVIRIRGARQNNLRGLDLDLPLHELIVVTGVSGSGKSSLAFDTVYSEGQRRYVETFSPYARQFLDRMDKPQVDRIEGIPPAIAIDQTNPVRTSRSTVGTMTELNDHVKLLYARAALLYCRNCGREVRRDDAESIYAELAREPAVGGAGARVLVTFTVPVPDNFSREEIETFLARQGYTRIHARTKTAVEVVQDRLAFDAREPRADRRGARGRAQGRQRPRDGAARRRVPTHGVQVLGAPALRAVRPRLRRLHPEHVLVQLARRRVRAMPRLRPHDRHRLPARDSGRGQDARGRRDQAVADEEQQGVPGRSAALREAARHPRRRAVARAHAASSAPGSSTAKARGGSASGTASRGSSRGSSRRPTRCTCACCCRSTAATTPARRAPARG